MPGIRPANTTDLIGRSFYNLTVIGLESHVKYSHTRWRCRCICGNEIIVKRGNLTSGGVRSCGCTRYFRGLPGETGIRRIIASYRSNAALRGLSFDLADDEVRRIVLLDCFYCGCSPKDSNYSNCGKNRTGSIFYNGIDRLDNTKGYSLDNCVPCCKTCNIAKGQLSYKEFKSWIAKISDYMMAKEIQYAYR